MNTLRLKIYGMIALMVLLGCTGDMLLSLAMKRIGPIQNWSPSALASVFLQTITSGTVWLGILLLLGFFVCYLAALSWVDFSYLKPSMAVSYAFVTFLAYKVLGETVTPLRWIGVALISCGVAVVAMTRVQTTAPARGSAAEQVAEHVS